MQPVLKHRSAFIQVVLGIILVVFILLIFFGCTRWGSKHIDPAPSPTVSGTSKALIDGADARRLVATGALLVDVRTPDEYNSAHIEGALNIPVQQLASRTIELGDPERTIVVYCGTGRRSSQAAEILNAAGFRTVHNLGAMSRW
jgi:phage shock protein E